VEVLVERAGGDLAFGASLVRKEGGRGQWKEQRGGRGPRLVLGKALVYSGEIEDRNLKDSMGSL